MKEMPQDVKENIEKYQQAQPKEPPKPTTMKELFNAFKFDGNKWRDEHQEIKGKGDNAHLVVW